MADALPVRTKQPVSAFSVQLAECVCNRLRKRLAAVLNARAAFAVAVTVKSSAKSGFNAASIFILRLCALFGYTQRYTSMSSSITA